MSPTLSPSKLAATTALAACLATLPVTAAVPPAEKLLGPDTLAVFTVPDWDKAATSLKESPIAGFWNDPAMQTFTDKFVKRLHDDLVTPIQDEFGIQFSDYADIVSDQFTIALLTPQKKDAEPSFLVLLDSGERRAELTRAINDFKKNWMDHGKTLKPQTIRGTEFAGLVFMSDDLDKSLENIFPDKEEGFEDLDADAKEDAKGEPERVELFLGQSDSLMILGDNVAAIEKLLARKAGGNLPTLQETPTYAKAYGAHFRGSLWHLWINFQTIIQEAQKAAEAEAGKDAPEPNPFAPPKPDQLLEGLGLSKLESLAIAYNNGNGGQQAVVSLIAPGREKKGLMKLLAFEQKDAAPPDFVPADAIKFSRWRLNLKSTWETLEQTLTELVPQMAGIFMLFIDNAGKDQDPNFDLRKSLIGNLGDDIVYYEKAPKENTLDSLNSPPSLTLIGSPRAKELANALKSLTALLPDAASVKEREFLGRKVYSIPLPDTQTVNGKPKRNRLTYVASGGYVAISTDEAMVEEFLRNKPEKTLRSTQGLMQAAEAVGGTSTGFFAYENDNATVGSALTILRKQSGNLNTLLKQIPGFAEEGNQFQDWIDFSLLPAYERVSKYFHFSVYSLIADEAGFTLKTFTPDPPKAP